MALLEREDGTCRIGPFPNACSTAGACGHDEPAIDCELRISHIPIVSERCEQRSVRIPHPSGVIRACGDDQGTGGADPCRADFVGVGERDEQVAGFVRHAIRAIAAVVTSRAPF